MPCVVTLFDELLAGDVGAEALVVGDLVEARDDREHFGDDPPPGFDVP